MTTKRFHLGDVFSITTGMLVSPTHMAGVHAILNWMTDDVLFTHQLPRASRECAPYLLRQYPALAELTGEGIGRDNWREWLDAAIKKHGEWLDVEPVPPHAHEFIDPISELAERVHPDNIIVVKT